MGKRSWDKGPKRPPKDPQAFRRRFCAAAEMKVSRYRRPARDFLDLKAQLQGIQEIYADASATECDLKGTITGLYEIKRDLKVLAQKAVEDHGPDRAAQYERHFAIINRLIPTFIDGCWPLSSLGEIESFQKEFSQSHNLGEGALDVDSATSENASRAISDDAPPAWELHHPRRWQGYSLPLYKLLEAAHKNGEARPTARKVLERWLENPPLGFGIEVSSNLRWLSYDSGGDQPRKTIGPGAITKTINRLAPLKKDS